MMTHITTSITMDTTWITAATTMLALQVLLSFVKLWQSQILHRFQISDVRPSSTIINHLIQSAISADIEDYEHGGYDHGKQHYVYHHAYDVGRSSHSYHVGAAHVSWLRYLWYFVVWESTGLSKPTGGLNYHLFSDPLLRSLTPWHITWGSSIGHGSFQSFKGCWSNKKGRASIWYSRSIQVWTLNWFWQLIFDIPKNFAMENYGLSRFPMLSEELLGLVFIVAPAKANLSHSCGRGNNLCSPYRNPQEDRAATSDWNRGRWLFYLFGASYTWPDLPHVPGLIPGWYQGLQTQRPWWPASLCLPPCHPWEQLRGARRPKITEEF